MAILDPSIIKQEIRDDFNKSIYYIKSNYINLQILNFYAIITLKY